jgi:plasmid stabilization system protein ParE
MGFKVILTPQAQDNLGEIVSFIARKNSHRAKSFGTGIQRAYVTDGGWWTVSIFQWSV